MTTVIGRVETTTTGRNTATRVTTTATETGRKNGYQHWSQNHKNYGNGWSGYHNSWNTRTGAPSSHWNPQPYMASSSAASFLDRFPAANGIGVGALCPRASSFVGTGLIDMIRGYWDYCRSPLAN